MSDNEERILCPDDMCVGTINESGFCNYCGKSKDGTSPEAEAETTGDPVADWDDEERIPCYDEMCTGTVNERGLCNYCQTPHPQYRPKESG